MSGEHLKGHHIAVGAAAVVALMVASGVPAPAAAPATTDGTPTRALVWFHEAPPDVTAVPGVASVMYAFTAEPAWLVASTPAGLAALALDPRVRSVTPDDAIGFDLATATHATQARAVWAGDTAVRDATGRIVDGTGVGIAVVDSGLDGTHPDFQAPGKVGGNWFVTPRGLVAAPNTHSGEPHGTHVAGIAAGTGEASNGDHAGAAPGASLFGFAVGPGATVAFPAIAFDWILTHGAEQDPPIRVVTNSWSCRSAACRTFNADALHVTLATRLAEAGVVVTWAGGNGGGNGVAARLNPEATNPTPGIIAVANYDDQDRGTRAGCAHYSSSRGAANAPRSWPDVAAPGTRITSTWPVTVDVHTRKPVPTPFGYRENVYRELTGTSMAAPHVAGIAALMLQANPALTPPAVEYILKATAAKPDCGLAFVAADPAHSFDGANYEVGHGLVDAAAAVAAATTFTQLPPPVPPGPLPPGWLGGAAGVAPSTAWAFSGESGLTGTPPPERQPRTRTVAPDESVVFTSAPVGAAVTVAGATVDAWLGTAGETPGLRFTDPRIAVTVQRVPDAGAPTVLASATRAFGFAPPGAPVHRAFVLPFEEAVTFAATDRLRVTLTVTSPLVGPEASWVLYWDAAATPSGVALGDRVHPLLPGTLAACAVRDDCASIGAARTHAGLLCVGGVVHRVRFTGPPGTVATLACNGVVATCVVPETQGSGFATCEGVTEVAPVLTGWTAACTYRTPDGARTGAGRCEALN